MDEVKEILRTDSDLPEEDVKLENDKEQSLDSIKPQEKSEQDSIKEKSYTKKLSKEIPKDDEYYSRFITKEEKKIKVVPWQAKGNLTPKTKVSHPANRNNYKNYKMLVRSTFNSDKPAKGELHARKPLNKPKTSQRVSELLDERRKLKAQPRKNYNQQIDDCRTAISSCINFLSKMNTSKQGNKSINVDSKGKRNYAATPKVGPSKELRKSQRSLHASTEVAQVYSSDKFPLQNCALFLIRRFIDYKGHAESGSFEQKVIGKQRLEE
eukprot:TRINITY_DN10204_c0_g1_i1.p1 TRINITY_DN10204_c0_g1~~TRINITY_DN10204_c0_g1_i1.p1  ORF type:complete len:267 (-),score=45.62 TRINITY_DN10204_c0_g1_i1:231-1031(-)